MAGPWEQYQAPAQAAPWDQYQQGEQAPAPKKEKEASIGDWIANTFGPNGNLRGSSIGGMMQGMADPVVGGVQLLANAVNDFTKTTNLSSLITGEKNGLGDKVNSRIAEKEKEYQAARAAAGRDGFDAARLAGNVAITAPMAGVGGVPASMAGRVGMGAAQGGAYAALAPVTDGGENFWTDKGKSVATGAAMGGVMAPVAGAIARVISPKANSADINLLQQEGVRLTPGQAVGGGIAKAEEKLQSVPILGDAIAAARARGIKDFNKAALSRAGSVADDTGEAGIAAAKKHLSAQYDEVIPKLQLNTASPDLVNKIGSLRGMVQSLPEREAKVFDDVITREIDKRLAPNGVLSGQNLKDALAAIRDKGSKFSKSPDAYQSDLGQAFKELHRTLLDDMMASNGANGAALKAIDKSYANFKRIERAQGSVANAGNDFSPAQLYSAVKALDRSKDKGQFAAGNSLMQDLAGAGKRVIGGNVPDSGTAGRVMMGGGVLGAGIVNPLIPAATLAGASIYTPAIQNALVKVLTREGGAKSQAVANKLRELMPLMGSQAVLAN